MSERQGDNKPTRDSPLQDHLSVDRLLMTKRLSSSPYDLFLIQIWEGRANENPTYV